MESSLQKLEDLRGFDSLSPGIQKGFFTCSVLEWSCYSSDGVQREVELSWLVIDFQTETRQSKVSPDLL